MCAESPLASDVADRQVAMFAMFVGPELYTTRAALSVASKIPDSTLRNWANGAAMPLHGALRLRRFLPPEAINMLTEPGGLRFTSVETTPSNWDLIAAGAAGLASQVCEERASGKIDHVGDSRLRAHARRLAAELSEVAGTD